MTDISASLEDYLEAIYILGQSNDFVRITDIAEFLKVSKPSVNKAVGILKEEEFLEHESYKAIKLTRKGKQRASKVLRRHKVIKQFLCENLGVDEKVAEADACRMEHVVSAQTVNKLYEYIKKREDKDEQV